MAVSRRRSSESADYLESSFEETDSKPSEGDTTLESLDTLDLNSSIESNIEERKGAVVIDYEREEGDGQEYESEEGQTITSGSSEDGEDQGSVAPKSEKKLDDDEDRRNPQYIPKRGTFYEHDDRTADDDGNVNDLEKEAERAKELLEKKKVWKEHENRWAHDKYNDDDQKPKSREELIELYGYDIRSEEGPPRARRRRRYGRGPNKYTRNWEDEDAYNKPSPMTNQSRGRRGGGPRGDGERYENDEQVSNRRRSEDDLRGNRRRPDERNSQMFYSNEVSGRRDDKREMKEAFPALPGSEPSVNDARRSPRDERPVTNAPTNPAWKKESPSAPNRLLRDEYSKSKTVNNGPLQLTPPPVRRELDVNRRRQDESSGSRPARLESHLVEFEPVKKGNGRGTMPGRRGKPAETAPTLVVARGAGGVVQRGVLQRGVYRGRTAPSRGTDTRESRSEPPADKTNSYQQQQAQGPKLRTQDDLVRDLARMTIYNQNQPPQGQDPQQSQSLNATREFTRRPQTDSNKNGNGYQRQAVVPPRLQQDAAANRPKRYSSLRQRSLPESGAPVVQPQTQAYSQPQHQFYQGGYVQQPVYAEAPRQPLPPQPSLQQPPLQLIHPPTTYAAAFPSPPTFIQPTPSPLMMRRPPSPHYLPPPPPPQAVINFVQPQPQFNPQPYPPFQGYTTVNPAPPPPTELYQPQGGITYYSPEEQIMPRAITRRQRSAIPIVPPPERLPRGRGRMPESEMYDTQVGGPDYGTSSSHGEIDYGASGNHLPLDYEASSEQYQDYEAPGDHSRSDYETTGNLSQSDYETSGDHASSDYKVSEEHLQPHYKVSEDHVRSDYEASGDHASDYKVPEDHSRSDLQVSGDHSRSDLQASGGHSRLDLEASSDQARSDHQASADHSLLDCKPPAGHVGGQLSPNSGDTAHTEQDQYSSNVHEDSDPNFEQSHDGGGDRAKSSASDEKYEDAAEVIPLEAKVAAL